jgi:hypothetical protein
MTPRSFRGEGPGDDLGEDPRDLLQVRPLEVIPLQVVAGFFESDLGRRASGVWGAKLMSVVQSLCRFSKKGTTKCQYDKMKGKATK